MPVFGLDLGPDVAVVALELEGLGAPGPARRQLEFSSGRRAAQLALARFGVSADVGRRQDGSPAWPAGMVGSISHGASLAVAAVARQCTHAGIGIDVEPIVDAQTYADVAGDVASMQELAVLRTALGALTNEALWTLVFSAKESVYKCLFPQTLRFMEFEDLRLIAVEPGAPAPRIRFRLERELSRSHPLGALFEASFHVGDSRVQTAVLDLPRR